MYKLYCFKVNKTINNNDVKKLINKYKSSMVCIEK